MSDETRVLAEALPVGAYVASALLAANYPGDSGEDVDRFIAELAGYGFEVVPTASLAALERVREAAQDAQDVADLWADAPDNALWDSIPVELADKLDALRAALDGGPK